MKEFTAVLKADAALCIHNQVINVALSATKNKIVNWNLKKASTRNLLLRALGHGVCTAYKKKET